MSRIITIHPVKETHRYGFETTQLYRAKVARYLGVDYIHLATSPQLRPDWKKEIIALGFLEEEIINVPNSFSDIGHDALSVRPEDLTNHPTQRRHLAARRRPGRSDRRWICECSYAC